MTLEEIEKLEAGREMDALIAQRVMGWNLRMSTGMGLVGDFPDDKPVTGRTYREIPRYSEDIAAAFQVVERMTSAPYAWYVETVNLKADGFVWRAVYWGGYDIEHCVYFTSENKSLPIAICRAALLAMEAAE